MHTCSILWVLIKYCFSYFMLKLPQLQPLGAFSVGSNVRWTHSQQGGGVLSFALYLRHLFIFWHYQILKAHLATHNPVLESAISPRSRGHESTDWDSTGSLTPTADSVISGLRARGQSHPCIRILWAPGYFLCILILLYIKSHMQYFYGQYSYLFGDKVVQISCHCLNWVF